MFRWSAAALMMVLTVSSAAASPGPTLYERLGAEQGVAAIAGALIDRTATDARTKRSFDGSDLARVKRLLAEQICDLADGPCQYSGDSMRDVHAGLGITQAELYLMVEFLREILAERNVELGARNELLSLLAPMKRDVVDP